jgi:Zn-dependent membrane protease YugP
MYLDIYYVILVLPCIILSTYAQVKISSAFKKYSEKFSQRGFTGAQVARRILDLNGLTHITVERISGNLTDHYDPTKKVVRLSDSVYSSTSVAALGVAAHETGHAIQHSTSYFPLRVRTAIFPIVNFSSRFAVPLAILGLLLGMQPLLNFGIILFSAVVIFQLVTLPVEFNASVRAIDILDSTGMLSESEIPAAKKVLKAAALTYLASALTSAMSLLRLILLSQNRRR